MKSIGEQDKEYVCDIGAPCFQMLSKNELELIKTTKTQVLFRKGDSLTKQGAFASYILFVVNGLCKKYIEGQSGKNLNLSIVTPGEFIGLSSLFTLNKFDYSVMALTDCHVFLVEREVILSVIKRDGDFGVNIVKRDYEQIPALYTKLKGIQFKQMNGRIADALLYLDTLRSSHKDIYSLLTRQDIADFAGITVESAVKIIKSFEKDNLIELVDKDIVIKNRLSLTEISHRG